MSAPYPWLDETWKRLLATRVRPAKALLLAGPRGVGKTTMARFFPFLLRNDLPGLSYLQVHTWQQRSPHYKIGKLLSS